MPWPRGVPRTGYRPGLSRNEEQLLEQMVYVEGIGEGVRALYHRIVARVGIQNAPARRDIAYWLRRQPGYQIARMPAKDKSVAPVLVTRPLQRVFADTMFLPRTAHQTPGVGLKVYRCVVVFVDALTKYMYLHGVFQLIEGRPQSEQTKEGAQIFLQRAQQVANDPNLQVEGWRTDKGSEWGRGANDNGFEAWREQQELAFPGTNGIAKSPGTRSSYNSIAEASIKGIRRLWHGHFRAFRHDLDVRGVPERQRPAYDWMQHIGEINQLWNTGYRSTIKTTPLQALNPAVAPTYAEVAQRIRRKARKKYGNRIDGAFNPGFSAEGLLQANQLVRLKKHHDGGGTARLTWDRVKGKTADANYSEQVYRIRSVNPGNGLRLTTYVIERLDNTDVNGNWSRQQLLPIPDDTNFLETDGDASDTSDDDIPDDATQDPRPPQRGGEARYKVGDMLQFNANYFVGNFPGLRQPLARARIGTVVGVPRALIGGRRAYTIRFGRPGLRAEATIDLPRTGQDGIDNDDDVVFIQ